MFLSGMVIHIVPKGEGLVTVINVSYEACHLE
jgi:hypothetical protein